jgi:hypothetical protein
VVSHPTPSAKNKAPRCGAFTLLAERVGYAPLPSMAGALRAG